MSVNNIIEKELENNDLYIFKDLFKSIKGIITLEKIYHDIFTKKLNINYYVDIKGKYYVELQKYIDVVTGGKCKERQLIVNKEAVDHSKILRYHELKIKSSYEVNKITPMKRLIRVDGLTTVNDSIRRFSSKNELNEIFFDWHKLCEVIILSLPNIIEKAVKKYFKNKFEEIDTKFTEQNMEMKKLREENDMEMKKLREENDMEMKKLREENDTFKRQLDQMRQLIEGIATK